VTVKTKRV